MALATQCPHCYTSFRVANDQLKLYAGLVRCGSCKQTFNGIEHLLTPHAKATAPAPKTHLDTHTETPISNSEQETSETNSSAVEPNSNVSLIENSDTSTTSATSTTNEENQVEQAYVKEELPPEKPLPISEIEVEAIAEELVVESVLAFSAYENSEFEEDDPTPDNTSESKTSNTLETSPVTLPALHIDQETIEQIDAVAVDSSEIEFEFEPVAEAVPTETTKATELPPIETKEVSIKENLSASVEKNNIPTVPPPQKMDQSVIHHEKQNTQSEQNQQTNISTTSQKINWSQKAIKPISKVEATFALTLTDPLTDTLTDTLIDTPSDTLINASASTLIDTSIETSLDSSPEMVAISDEEESDDDDEYEEDSYYDEQIKPQFVIEAERKQRYGKWLTIFYSLCIPLLLIVALGQLTFYFRDTIYGYFPQTKPHLIKACAILNCKIHLLAEKGAVIKESQELVMLSSNPQILTLSVQLHNQSGAVQAWPMLELTLMDNRKKTLLQRVFTPSQYLDNKKEINAGIPSHSEKNIDINFELGIPKAASYEVKLFYP